MLSLAMGMRQSWGLFQPHMIRDLGITAADFSFALAIQNIVWGATQPFVGMIADRFGARLVAVLSVLIYAAGLLISLYAESALMLPVVSTTSDCRKFPLLPSASVPRMLSTRSILADRDSSSIGLQE